MTQQLVPVQPRRTKGEPPPPAVDGELARPASNVPVTARVAPPSMESITSLLQIAIEKGIEPASLERLVALQERLMARTRERLRGPGA